MIHIVHGILRFNTWWVVCNKIYFFYVHWVTLKQWEHFNWKLLPTLIVEVSELVLQRANLLMLIFELSVYRSVINTLLVLFEIWTKYTSYVSAYGLLLLTGTCVFWHSIEVNMLELSNASALKFTNGYLWRIWNAR